MAPSCCDLFYFPPVGCFWLFLHVMDTGQIQSHCCDGEKGSIASGLCGYQVIHACSIMLAFLVSSWASSQRRPNEISNTLWAIYFAVVGTRGFVGFVRYGFTADRANDADSALFITGVGRYHHLFFFYHVCSASSSSTALESRPFLLSG